MRAILATHGLALRPTAPGQALVLTLPSVPGRSLDAYRIQPEVDGVDVSPERTHLGRSVCWLSRPAAES